MRRISARYAFLTVGVVGLMAVGGTASSKPADPTAPRVKQLLPNLVPLPPFEVYIDESTNGCDIYERVEEGAQRCLRYDTTVANFGRGPLELRYRVDGFGRDQHLDQRIYRSDGTFTDRVADKYVFHPTHGHFHYANFAMARLWKSNEKQQKLGSTPVRQSLKAGFCMVDGDNYWSGRKDSAAQRYKDPEACYPSDVSDGVAQVNGLSKGWVDTYEAALTDQYIEVTGVPHGDYLLEIVIDPLNTLREVNENDNSLFVWIQI